MNPYMAVRTDANKKIWEKIKASGKKSDVKTVAGVVKKLFSKLFGESPKFSDSDVREAREKVASELKKNWDDYARMI
jgi:hypothetical protein